MKRIKSLFKAINFKAIVALFCFCLMELSLFNSIWCFVGASPSEYYSRTISSKGGAVMVQECSGVNFLSNNDFYVGYELNYYYTTSYIKTFFHSNVGDDQFFFFSSNTGMTEEKYLAPNICRLSILAGDKFKKDWQEYDCYVSESKYKSVFGDAEFNYQTIESNGNMLKIIGVIDDNSLGAVRPLLGTERIYVSYNYATKHLNSNYRLVSIFEKNDYVGNKRYLDYYFARYLVLSKWNNEIKFIEEGGHDVAVVYKNYYSVPFLFIGIISVLFLAFAIIKDKRTFIAKCLASFNIYIYFFFSLLVVSLQLLASNALFLAFSYVLTSKTIIFSFLFLLVVGFLLNYFKRKLYQFITTEKRFFVVNI